MNALMRLIAFDFRLYLRDWLTIFWMLVYPILMLLIFGSIFGNQAGAVEGALFIDSYIPALCAMNVITVSVFTLNINMITQRESGILRRYRVSPIRSSAVLISQSIQGIILVLAGAIEIIVIASLVWDIKFSVSSMLLLFVCLLFGSLSFFSLGFALSGLTNTAGAASGLAMAVFFPTLFLSGIAMPVDILPTFMQRVSEWLPMSYYVDLVRGVWLGEPITSFGLEFVIMIGFAICCWVLALLLFRWGK
jgi:ABC-2 type transport system permease protein